MMDIALVVRVLCTCFALLLALCLGSFATALAYRIPRGIGMGGAHRRSACPACKTPLGFLDLIPVLSWAFLRGRCRHCRGGIGWRYPLIETATFILCVAFLAVFGLSFATVVLFFLAPVLVAMSDIDLQYKILPDVLNLSVAVIGLVYGGVIGFEHGAAWSWYGSAMETAIFGAALYGAGSWFLMKICNRVLKKETMGMGDIKFFTAAGVWLGPGIARLSFFMIAAGAGGIILALLWRRFSCEREFPFGPALVVGLVLTLLAQGSGF